ncbi:hypothetical protein CH63R_12273 [Colletotrichum higginsianum IMI 349063]|uniref:Zn(2)-C6 fungal-type domain-containing protein n=1 Tax=Colletotrichum higginsianum (strain IMI 349063) TaxID=759273 RepID=A0A1B7Y0M3_COLHI|nr:hypothetical protein CH63R_12273 [Colletotrichum higginsianum IMI 349063]OBR05570.1 hypothetical protein CH63R_12273 [Colletotrichum higginsianum IMI 349063]
MRTQAKCIGGTGGCKRCVARNRRCEYSPVSVRSRRGSSIGAEAGLVAESAASAAPGRHPGGARRRRASSQSSASSLASPSSQCRAARARLSPARERRQDSIMGLNEGPLSPSNSSPVDLAGHVAFPDLDLGDFISTTPSPAHMAVDDFGEGLAVVTGAAAAKGGTAVPSMSAGNMPFTFALDNLGFSRISGAEDFASPAQRSSDGEALARPAASTSAKSSSVYTSCCSCIFTAMSLHEAVQIDLVWNDLPPDPSAATRPLGEPSCELSSAATFPLSPSFQPLITQQTILHRQKTVLARLDSLLWCGPCWSRSNFVILIITMSERILGSLESVERVVRRKHEHGGGGGGTQTATADPANPWLAGKTGALTPPPSAGGWQIDDDDEQRLVVSLLRSRMARLGSTIAMAEGAVSANAWSSHDRMVQALRKRFNSLLFSLSFSDLS